jgi:hypothetical protein
MRLHLDKFFPSLGRVKTPGGLEKDNMKDREIRLQFARKQVARLIHQRRTELRDKVWRTEGKRSELQGEVRGLRLAVIWLRHATR